MSAYLMTVGTITCGCFVILCSVMGDWVYITPKLHTILSPQLSLLLMCVHSLVIILQIWGAPCPLLQRQPGQFHRVPAYSQSQSSYTACLPTQPAGAGTPKLATPTLLH